MKLKWAVNVNNVGDGTIAGASQYCKVMGIEALSVDWDIVPGFKEKGYLEADAVVTMRDEIMANGIEWGPMVAWAPRDLPKGAAAAAHFANLQRTFAAMAAAGTEIAVMFPPGQRDTPWDEVIAYYRPLIAIADEFNIKVGLHGHGRFMPSKVQKQLMAEIPSKNNGLTLCSGNLFHGDGEAMYDSARELAEMGKVFYCHVRNVKKGEGEKEYWMDQGDVDVPRYIAALKAGGYTGYVRCEHLPTDQYRTFVPGKNGVSDIGNAYSLGFLRQYLR
jgi:sugar phosphate isomerase/epimerase